MTYSGSHEIVRLDGEPIAGPFASRDAAEQFAACISELVDFRILTCATPMAQASIAMINRTWPD